MGRFLHTMLRVGDLQRSVDFYTKAFGMNEIRRRDVPDGKYTLVFLGYGPEESHTALELTYNYGVEKYDLGTAYGHIALGVDDVAATCAVAGAESAARREAPCPSHIATPTSAKARGRYRSRCAPRKEALSGSFAGKAAARGRTFGHAVPAPDGSVA